MTQVLRLLVLFLIAEIVHAQGVDHRYAPSRQMSAICFPDDWMKTVVTEDHALGYDFGPGPYAVPFTLIRLGLQGEKLHLERQEFADPKVPIAIGQFTSAGGAVQEEAFAVVFEQERRIKSGGRRITRLEGWTGTRAWAALPDTVNPAFSGVAWGVNRPVLYRVRLPRGSEHEVALGVLEAYKSTPGARALELKVEGAAPIVVDPLQEGRKGEPRVFLFHARDENRDGWLSVEVHASSAGLDPNCYLNAFWIFPKGVRPSRDALIHGTLAEEPEVFCDCGREEESWREELRLDALVGKFPGGRMTPEAKIHTLRNLRFDEASGLLLTDGRPYILTRPKAIQVTKEEDDWRMEFPPGTAHAELYVLSGPWTEGDLARIPSASEARARTISFWQHETKIPRGRIVLPERSIQQVLEANERNLYQIREKVDGVHQFQPGPSVYRGLWIHDAVWHLSAAAMLGDLPSVREELEGILTFQHRDGQIKVIEPIQMNRETPLVVFIMERYARWANDRAWLARHWSAIERGLEWLARLREQTLQDPSSPGYGLFPPGFADGGVGGSQFEYASVYWGLLGFRAGRDAALWLRKDSLARRWNQQFDDLLKSFRKAATRDARRDPEGNLYLPMKVGDTSRSTPPQLANYGILDAQGVGHLFDPRDDLVNGTLSMLNATLVEGLPPDAGWLRHGVWPFFGSLQAIAEVYQRDYAQAYRLLDAVVEHSAPLGTWFEEQLPIALGARTSGDGSDATASALFIMLARDLIATERGDTLDLLEGVPGSWFHGGARIALRDVPTSFGRITLEVHISRRPNSGTLTLESSRLFRRAVVNLHLDGLRAAGYRSAKGSLPASLTLRFGKPFTLGFYR